MEATDGGLSDTLPEMSPASTVKEEKGREALMTGAKKAAHVVRGLKALLAAKKMGMSRKSSELKSVSPSFKAASGMKKTPKSIPSVLMPPENPPPDKYRCEVCNKHVNSFPAFVKHQELHSENRRFPCEICKKRFLSRSHHTEHQRIHTGERPFPCTTCERSFTTRHNLTRHQRLHCQSRKLRCKKCNALSCVHHKQHRKKLKSGPGRKLERGASVKPPPKLRGKLTPENKIALKRQKKRYPELIKQTQSTPTTTPESRNIAQTLSPLPQNTGPSPQTSPQKLRMRLRSRPIAGTRSIPTTSPVSRDTAQTFSPLPPNLQPSTQTSPWKLRMRRRSKPVEETQSNPTTTSLPTVVAQAVSPASPNPQPSTQISLLKVRKRQHSKPIEETLSTPTKSPVSENITQIVSPSPPNPGPSTQTSPQKLQKNQHSQLIEETQSTPTTTTLPTNITQTLSAAPPNPGSSVQTSSTLPLTSQILVTGMSPIFILSPPPYLRTSSGPRHLLPLYRRTSTQLCQPPPPYFITSSQPPHPSSPYSRTSSQPRHPPPPYPKTLQKFFASHHLTSALLKVELNYDSFRKKSDVKNRKDGLSERPPGASFGSRHKQSHGQHKPQGTAHDMDVVL